MKNTETIIIYVVIPITISNKDIRNAEIIEKQAKINLEEGKWIIEEE